MMVGGGGGGGSTRLLLLLLAVLVRLHVVRAVGGGTGRRSPVVEPAVVAAVVPVASATHPTPARPTVQAGIAERAAPLCCFSNEASSASSCFSASSSSSSSSFSLIQPRAVPPLRRRWAYGCRRLRSIPLPPGETRWWDSSRLLQLHSLLQIDQQLLELAVRRVGPQMQQGRRVVMVMVVVVVVRVAAERAAHAERVVQHVQLLPQLLASQLVQAGRVL
uniref:Secreted protein n=1 Tax=Anopheles melas TaxID=34690 RepID=A0A182U1I8_9DIPT